MKDVYSWDQPLFIATLGPIELLDLFLKHGENAVSRIARPKPVSERVREKILLGALFVRFQGIVEN